MNLATAIAITAEGFKGKTDKAGKPYILHCLRVMNNLNTTDEELMMIAVMHDNTEDKIHTLRQLIDFGFSQRVIYALTMLDHDPAVPYFDYIKTIAHNNDARLVKLADLKDNSDITRLKGLTKKDHDRIEKYHLAFTYLSKT